MVHSAGEDLSKRVMLKLLDVFTDKKVGNTVKLLGGTWKIEDIQMCCLSWYNKVVTSYPNIV